MEYTITEKGRNFIINYFTSAKNLPLNYLEVNDLLQQIQPMVKVEQKPQSKPIEAKTVELNAKK